MRAVVALAILLLAGCLQGPSEEERMPGPTTPEPTADRTNRFLLGLPTPPGTRVSGGAEPSILADRAGQYLWIGDTSGLRISTDNGTSWSRGASPFLASADGWALAQDDAGALYFSTTTVPSIEVARSTDGGRTATVSRFVDVAPVADRPWLAARGDGEVAMIFYAYGRVFDEACARSTDGGRTWTDRDLLYGSPQAGNLAFGPKGELYYMDSRGTLYQSPAGCGGPLGATKRLQVFPSLGSAHMLQVAVDGDTVYAAAPASGDASVLVAGVRDMASPRRVTVAPPGLVTNIFPVLSHHAGEVVVAWYGSETEGDPTSSSFPGEFNVYLARIRDFWGTPAIDYLRLTTEPNHVGGVCMDGVGCTDEDDRDLLDYFGIDHDIWGGVHVAYGHDGATSTAEVRYAHVPPRHWDLAGGVSGAAGDLVAAFTFRVQGMTVDVDGTPTGEPEASYTWDWGDGAATTGIRSQHTYATEGFKQVTLTVRHDGSTASVTRALAVAPQPEEPPSPPASPPPAPPAEPSPGAQASLPPEAPPQDQDAPGAGIPALLALALLGAWWRRPRRPDVAGSSSVVA